MTESPKQKAVLYIDRSNCYFYLENRPNIIRCELSTAAVNNLEVINTTALQTELQACITQNKISLADTIILLSNNLLFQKQVLLNQVNEKEIQDFLESVPFEEVVSVKIPSDKNIQIIATNKRFFGEIKQVLEGLGFNFEIVIPFFLLGKETFQIDAAKTAWKRLEELRQYNMYEKPAIIALTKEKNTPQKQNPVSLIILVSIFVLLIAILAFLLLRKPTQPTVINTFKPPLITPTPIIPTVTTTPIASTSASLASKSITKIQIIDASDQPIFTDSVKTKLLKAGYTNIIITKNVAVNGQKILVQFSSQLSNTIKEDITNQLTAIYNNNISFQELVSSQYDAVITLTKL